MGEDVTKVSPTLGFIIKTIDYDGYVPLSPCLPISPPLFPYPLRFVLPSNPRSCPPL